MPTTRERKRTTLRDEQKGRQRSLVVLLAENDGDLIMGVRHQGITVCRSSRDLDGAVEEGHRRTVWLSHSASLTDELLKRMVGRQASARNSWLLLLQPPRVESIPSLSGLFQVLGAVATFRWLPLDELVEVLAHAERAKHLFIGGAADPDSGTIALVRGDLAMVVVPLSIFQPSGDGTVPDFTRLAFADYGHTVVLGNYEAAADSILYESDPAYRRTLQGKRREEDRSFGAALRRLRKQRRLRQSDFDPLPARTIARIERNEVAKPHRDTLEIIAGRLGVEPGDIATY